VREFITRHGMQRRSPGCGRDSYAVTAKTVSRGSAFRAK